MLNTEVTPEFVKASGFDVLIAAVGASAIIPGIPGINSDKVVMAEEAEKDIESLGTEIVVLGGGLVGCESAVNLGMAGKRVTIIEMKAEVAPEANVIHKMALKMELDKYVKIVTNTTGKRITEDGIICEDAEGNEVLYRADRIICSVGLKARSEAVEALRGLVDDFHVIGDCVKPRQVAQAITTAYYLAKNI
ncbi:MAG: FAD-dependent oxidoreductase [Clostridiales bacterium]|nr:FAD-dependent oxidoreductase [Clostridiales bacterium]